MQGGWKNFQKFISEGDGNKAPKSIRTEACPLYLKGFCSRRIRELALIR